MCPKSTPDRGTVNSDCGLLELSKEIYFFQTSSKSSASNEEIMGNDEGDFVAPPIDIKRYKLTKLGRCNI